MRRLSHLRLGEGGGSHVLHVKVWALKDERVGQAHDHVVGFTIVVAGDPGLRELREADREVQLGVRIVGGPALPARLAAAARVDTAAEVEAAAEVVGFGKLRGIAARPPALEAAELRRGHRGHAEQQKDRNPDRPHFAPPSADLTCPSLPATGSTARPASGTPPASLRCRRGPRCCRRRRRGDGVRIRTASAPRRPVSAAGSAR